jgi:hypothetical protein
MSDEPEIPVRIVSMFGHQTRQPYVVLTVGDAKPLTFTSEKAKEIGSMLVETAMASEADAFLAEWAVEATGCGNQGAVSLIREFRAWRQRRAERGGI